MGHAACERVPAPVRFRVLDAMANPLECLGPDWVGADEVILLIERVDGSPGRSFDMTRGRYAPYAAAVSAAIRSGADRMSKAWDRSVS